MSAKRICGVCGKEYEADQKFCPNDGSPLRSGEPTEGLVGQIIADRYRVISTLGEGGMGRVYLAEHVRMRRQCAVKVISPALAATDAAVARFNREAENASQINHPNVVQVYDFGEGPNQTLYLAMEYVEGETIGALIRREGPISLRRAASMMKQVSDALTAAHHRGIVHRDLKPDNILVTRQLDGTEWIKVVDFGIAKTVQADETPDARGGQTVTTVGVSIGTPEYMSPEQLAGERLDTRTDLYSLGLVFFHLLTGDLPFPPVTSREALIRRLSLPPRTLHDVRPSHPWPETLQPVLDRALAAERDERYPTAADFARDLSALVAAAPPEPDVTVPLKTAGLAQSAAVTVKERAPAAPTVPEKVAATVVSASAPVQPAKRRVGPILIASAAAAVAIAGILFALNRDQASPSTPPTLAAGDSAVATPPTTPAPSTDSAPTSVAVRAESTVRQPTTPPATTERSAPRSVATSQPVTTSAVDSTRPPVGGAAAMRIQRGLAPRHPYLQANGDSSTGVLQLAAVAPIPMRLAALQKEVDGHVARGRRHVLGGNIEGARTEFRTAVQEVTNAVTLLPNNPDALRLRDSVGKSLRSVIMQCQAALQRGALRPADRTFKCPSLVPGRFLGGRGRGAD